MFDHTPIWHPSAQRIEHALLTRFIASINHSSAEQIHNYARLHQWSIEHSERFWSQVWQFCQVVGDAGEPVLEDGPSRFGDPIKTRDQIWFAQAQLNYAENLLETAMTHPERIVIRFHNEQGDKHTLTGRELCQQVSQIQQWLKAQGISEGDVVAAYLPYLSHTVVAMLATTSLGAIWTSVSPDFGVESVVERFSQTEPKVLFCCDHYRFAGKAHAMQSKNASIVAKLPSLDAICLINNPSESNREHPSNKLALGEMTLSKGTLSKDTLSKKVTWHEWQAITEREAHQTLTFCWVNFNAPLFILYSSGTTGAPKCIVHSVGGTLLNHLKEHQLHCDIQPEDRVFYYTTCGWMMWNWHVSSLASGACLVIYDGSPSYPNLDSLWALTDHEDVSLFGTSAKYLETLAQHHYAPNHAYRLSALKTVCSTGSVLYPEQFDYVYQHIKSDLHLASISGGTDICGCFVIGNPISPVYRGECQYAALGVDVAAVNSKGRAITERRGELVCHNSLPNFPCGFWRDNGARYHNAYWQAYPNVWHHGDDVAQSPHGGWLFFGRSDATLNPGGVRIGTAELYRQLAAVSDIEDAIAVGKQTAQGEVIWLFVKLKAHIELNETLKEKISTTLRTQCSPRHVPNQIFAVPDIPKTRSGKLVEIAVKRLVNQQKVDNIGAIANPEALDAITQIIAKQSMAGAG